MSELKNLTDLALNAVKIAKESILSFYQNDLLIEWKSDATPVTIADKKAEELMREFLIKEMPGCGFVGEEFGYEKNDGEYTWIMDPIDGTKSFIHGVPLFGTLLALYKGDEALVGVISMPALNSVLWASKGQGAFLDGVKTSVSKVKTIDEALVLSNSINTLEDQGLGDKFKQIRQSAKLFRGWGDCYGYYLAACGRAEVVVDPVVSLWDIAPLPVIFNEAGGKFTTLDGSTNIIGNLDNLESDKLTGIATNGHLHEYCLNKFK